MPDAGQTLGEFELSLCVRDLEQAIEFYSRFGMQLTGGVREQGWVTMAGAGLRLGLYQGHIEQNYLTFFVGDVHARAQYLQQQGLACSWGPEQEADGTVGAKLLDPDGNLLYLNNP